MLKEGSDIPCSRVIQINMITWTDPNTTLETSQQKLIEFGKKYAREVTEDNGMICSFIINAYIASLQRRVGHFALIFNVEEVNYQMAAHMEKQPIDIGNVRQKFNKSLDELNSAEMIKRLRVGDPSPYPNLREFVAFPFYDGFHWTAAVAIMSKNVVVYMDSLHSEMSEKVGKFLHESFPNFRLESLKVPRQNGFSCGAHACFNIANVILGLPPNATNTNGNDRLLRATLVDQITLSKETADYGCPTHLVVERIAAASRSEGPSAGLEHPPRKRQNTGVVVRTWGMVESDSELTNGINSSDESFNLPYPPHGKDPYLITREADIGRLMPESYLNDAIIDFFLHITQLRMGPFALVLKWTYNMNPFLKSKESVPVRVPANPIKTKENLLDHLGSMNRKCKKCSKIAVFIENFPPKTHTKPWFFCTEHATSNCCERVSVVHPNLARFVAFPLNENMHWYAAVADFKEHALFIMDSLPLTTGQRPAPYKIVEELLNPFSEKTNPWTIKVRKVPEQKNLFDCGVHMCLNIFSYLHGCEPIEGNPIQLRSALLSQIKFTESEKQLAPTPLVAA